jgi:hypothetical protein
MSFFNVILEDEDFVVLGPPEQIDVSVNVGQRGPRGSRFFVGDGDPNFPGVIPAGENPQLGDVFVNTSTAAQFGWLYVYLRAPSGNQWVPALRLQPSVYARNSLVIFTSGTAVISIPLSNIVPDVIIPDVDRYVINLAPQHPNPIAFSITSKDIAGSNLVFTIKATEYSSSSWIDLIGSVILGINVVVI